MDLSWWSANSGKWEREEEIGIGKELHRRCNGAGGCIIDIYDHSGEIWGDMGRELFYFNILNIKMNKIISV